MFNFMFANKKYWMLILFLIGILLLTLIITFSQGPDTPLQSSPKPSSSSQPNTNLPSLPPNANELPNPYQPEKLNEDYQRIIERQQLSSQDASARERLTYPTEGMSGVIRRTNDYQIEYVKSANAFIVEIRSDNADEAKKQATNWFKEQGLSIEGICNLPVVFYLGSSARVYYSENNLQFNPIPEGCQ